MNTMYKSLPFKALAVIIAVSFIAVSCLTAICGTEAPVIRNEMFDVLPITPSGYFSVNQVAGKGFVVDVA